MSSELVNVGPFIGNTRVLDRKECAMNTRRPKVDFGFCEEQFPAGTHMCLIYNSEDERERVIAQYIQSGLAQKEKVAYFFVERTPVQIRTWLHEYGLADLPVWDEQHFDIQPAVATYCPHGRFDPGEMLETLKGFHTTATAENYTGSRVTGEMDWALQGIPGSERLMEYEAKVNQVIVDYPVNAICQYDARRFDGATILECLKVHPYMIVRGQIVQNPYYLSPDEYLKQSERGPFGAWVPR